MTWNESRWRSVAKDGMPRDGLLVQVTASLDHDPRGQLMPLMKRMTGDWLSPEGIAVDWKITHWRPLA